MSQQDHKDFFISYNGADQRWAEWIAWQLEEAAYSVIVQAWDFLPGSNFVVEMDRALTLAPHTIAVLSPQYLSALYTQPEWAAVFRRDPRGEQSLLIPVRVQACEVIGLLGQIVYVDLVGQDEATARQRLLAAARHERAKPAQAPAFPQTMQHTISKQLNFPGGLPPIWKMPHQRDPLFLGREQLLQELHTTLTADHKVILFEPARELEAGTSGATETAVEYAYRYQSDYHVVAWIQANSRAALQSDLLSLAAALHLPQANPVDQDPLTAVVQWLHTHQHWLLVLDQVQEKEVLAPLMPLPEQGYLLVVTSARSLESLAPLLELSQVPWEERTVLTQLSQVVGAALQGPQGRVPLGLEPITIGRASTNQVILSDPSVSPHHATIELKDQAYWITDTGSTNGTLLNQQRLVPQVPSRLHPGDTIGLGNITCTYEVLDRPSRSRVSLPSSEQESTSAGAYPPPSPILERPRQDRVGQRFGNYRLSRLLGLGGFAEVYLGEHIFLDTQTAIKVLHTQLVGQDVEQFRQEAQTIAHLEHPYIVRLLDFGVEGTTPYLIMSYAPNGTMRQRYPEGTRMPLDQAVTYVKQIAKALQYAHDHKVIHRDIKPENMLFGSDDQVVLSDFGIALVTQSSLYQQPNDMAGTIAYMAPERIDAHPRSASDQYSLGIVVYEWLCGERPFQGSFTEIAAKQQLTAPPSLREKVPSLSAEVEQVVMTALAKDPEHRFASVREFAHALEQACLPNSPTVPVVLQVPDAPPRQPKHQSKVLTFFTGRLSRRTVLIGLTSLVAVGGGLTGVELASKPPPRGTLFHLLPQDYIVRAVAWSPDGTRLASADNNKEVKIWDTASGADIFTYSKHANATTVYAVAWSPDGKHIASGADDYTAQVWDATTGARNLTYSKHANSVYAVAWSPDGKHIASGSYDGTAQVWDAITGRHVLTYMGHTNQYSGSPVNAVAWSPDGTRIASASDDGTAQVWDATTGRHLFTYMGHSGGVQGVAWSPDGMHLASGGTDQTVQVWSPSAAGNLNYPGHSGAVEAVAWSSDGQHLASGSDDMTVRVWDLSPNGNPYIYRNHTNVVYTVAWSPGGFPWPWSHEGQRLASGGQDMTVHLWQAV